MSQKTTPMSARDALARLRDGNARFSGNIRSVESLVNQAHRPDLVAGQSPFAIILCCSDSRVPAEIVFDCGLGDLFVVRVAGNIVAPSLVGSIEFAAATFGSELVVVMGHTSCGAVSATLDALEKRDVLPSPNIRDIVERIAPSVAELARPGAPRAEVMRTAIRANVRAATSHLRHGSAVLERRVSDGKLAVVGAEYDLATGRVDFFDGVESLTQPAS